MKLVLAIVRNEDASRAMSALNEEGFSVTRLATTGGFLRAGNTTLLIGADEEKVGGVIEIFKDKCKKHKQVITTPVSAGLAGSLPPYPVAVEVGGATIFVMDVERFERI